MNILIDLPDLLVKLKMISYSDYQVEETDEQVFITLVTRQSTIRYQIAHCPSQAKQGEIGTLLSQYRS